MYAFAVLADMVYRGFGGALSDNRRFDGLNLVGQSSRRDLRRLRFCLFLRCRGFNAGSRAICPNCGCANNGIDLLPDLDGDRLLIDRSAYHFRRPRRWEIAAFRHPREASKIVIKRVAGLPGESVQIQNGDVYINGQIQRKTLDCQRSMALMVYDANYSPTVTPGRPALPPRWQGENEKSLWNSANGRFTHP